MAISYRVLLTRRVAPADPKEIGVGKLRDGQVYELFLTSQPAASLPAASVLELYQHRGSFEQVLSDEDVEQDPERWCSHTPCGQEFWQLICQWVSPTRLSLGQLSHEEEVRWTAWESGTAVSAQEVTATVEVGRVVEGTDGPAGATAETTASGGASEAGAQEVPSYGELCLSYSWMWEPGPYAAAQFREGEGDTLICPEGKLLRRNERRVQANGELGVLMRQRSATVAGVRSRRRVLGRAER